MSDYNFLLASDYDAQIRKDILGIITDDTERIRTQAEVAAIEQAKTVLATRHDIDCLFPQLLPYIPTITYAEGNQVIFGGILYEALQAATGQEPPAPYADGTNYSINDKVIANGQTYTCIQVTTGVEHPTDPAFWTLDANLYWILSTKRNPYLVLVLVDMVLYHIHSRISPNNIPKLRLDRYQEALDWIHEVSMGRATLSECLKTDTEGAATGGLSWGSNQKAGNSW